MLAGPEVYVSARDAAGRDLQKLKAELERTYSYQEGSDYEVCLLEGEIAQAILDFARDRCVDLIVVGTHGRGALPKVLLGSVAEQVFRNALVPVLTLGPELCGWALRDEPKVILVPTDFTPASRRAVQHALALAQQHNSQLTLLHVIDPKRLQHLPDPAAVERGIQARMAELLGREAENPRCSIRIVVGRVSQIILQTAIEQAADLLVMGVRPSSGVLDRLMIPHAYDVVRHSPCPVLTIREQTKLE